MCALRLDLDYASPLWTSRRSLTGALRQAAQRVFQDTYVPRSMWPAPDCKRIVIAVKLTDDAEMRALNRHFRQIDKPTNVLSFPSLDEEAMDEPSFLGNIAIGYETVKREALQDNKAFLDHLVHLLVHGCLHLVGFDHLEIDEAQEMEALEIDILAGLGIANPYAEFDLVQKMNDGA